jgi:hypothetical protein
MIGGSAVFDSLLAGFNVHDLSTHRVVMPDLMRAFMIVQRGLPGQARLVELFSASQRSQDPRICPGDMPTLGLTPRAGSAEAAAGRPEPD